MFKIISIRYTLLYIDWGVYIYGEDIPQGHPRSIYYKKNQLTCKDGGLLLNMAQMSEWNEQVRAIFLTFF